MISVLQVIHSKQLYICFFHTSNLLVFKQKAYRFKKNARSLDVGKESLPVCLIVEYFARPTH